MKLNNIVAFNEERELAYMTLKEFFDNKTVPFQNIILMLNITNQTLKFDCAKLSYREYQSKGSKGYKRIRHIASPVRGTLRDSSSLNLTQRYIKHRLVEGASHATIKGILFQLTKIYIELDSLNVEQNWSDEQSQLELYKKYSENLYLTFQQELKNEKKTNILYTNQSLLADLISFNLDIDKTKLKKIAWQIPLQKGNHRQPVGENDLKNFSKTNLLTFRKIKTFLMENKVFPLIIEDKKLGIRCVEVSVR